MTHCSQTCYDARVRRPGYQCRHPVPLRFLTGSEVPSPANLSLLHCCELLKKNRRFEPAALGQDVPCDTHFLSFDGRLS